jgi:signal transduction histidine kinase
MSWTFTPYAIGLMFMAGIVSTVSIIIWQRRRTPGGGALAWLMMAAAIWSLAGGFEAAAVGIPAKVLWSKIQYLGVTSAPVFFGLFAWQYSRQDNQLARRYWLLLGLIPLVTLVLAWTNEGHRLIWTGFVPAAENLLIYQHGAWFWVAVVYDYALLGAGTLMLIQTFRKSRGLYRQQNSLILSGAVLPLVWNVLYVFDLGPLPGLDLTPLAFGLTGLLMTLGMFRYEWLDVSPIARDLLIDSLSDGMLVLDAAGRVIDLNPALAQLLPLPADRVIGRPIAPLIETSPWLGGLNQAAHTAETNAALSIGDRQFDWRVSPVTTRQGLLIGRLLVLRDVTEYYCAEAALRQANLELSVRNDELDAFAHTVAHDLKNPLHQVSGYAELLRDNLADLTPDQRQTVLDGVVHSAEKMNRIIEELLLLAGVRSTKVKYQPVSMKPIVAEVCARLARLIEDTQAVLVLPDHWPLAIGHAAWVEEVWANYLSNGCKYGGAATAAPYLEFGADSRPDGYVRFWLRDRGNGIAPDDQARLFAAFMRLDHVQAKGFGLGLSIVGRIVEKMGGTVGVESRGVPGQGSLFYFTLPAAPIVPEEERVA